MTPDILAAGFIATIFLGALYIIVVQSFKKTSN